VLSDFERRQTAARVTLALARAGALAPTVAATCARVASTRALVRAGNARRAAACEQRRDERAARRRSAALRSQGAHAPSLAALAALLPRDVDRRNGDRRDAR
jgi:hypothetical protein